MSGKKFTIATLSLTIAGLICIIGFVVFIDPFFQYHKPLPFLEYRMLDGDNSAYQTVGIAKSFGYNGIITGTSMTQNFKPSIAEELFGGDFVKASLPGANFVEINDLLEISFIRNGQIDTVIRGLDYSRMTSAYDERFNENAPLYLYDNNLLNDLSYLLNIDILIESFTGVLLYTLQGNETITLDDYGTWYQAFDFSKEAVLSTYTRPSITQEQKELTEEQAASVTKNIEENVIKLAREHPETTFYLFYPPYSVAYWDVTQRNGELNYMHDVKLLVTKLILEVENIKLFSFEQDREIITNLDNYKDQAHYSEEINELMLEYMSRDEYLLTEENYLEILQADREFLQSYDYESIYSSQ